MKLLIFPRDPNPYQRMLYNELEKFGIQAVYIGRLTPFPTLNILLLPLEIVARRITGGQVLHLHWMWGFSFPRAHRFPMIRRFSQSWYNVVLQIAELVGLRLAWTAHNVLPHAPIFADDILARCLLVKKCDVVFVHSAWTLSALKEIDAEPRRWALIRHPSFNLTVDPIPTKLRAGDTFIKFLFFGKIFEYKGLDNLLAAFAQLPPNSPAHLTIAGECNDPELRSKVEKLAQGSGKNVSLRLERIPDSEIASLMAEADVVVLPFRRITTSGSSILALGYGKPLVIPDLPALVDLPDEATFRYDGSIEGLRAALQAVISTEKGIIARMSAAALAYSYEATWSKAAAITVAEFNKVLSKSLVMIRLVKGSACRCHTPEDSSDTMSQTSLYIPDHTIPPTYRASRAGPLPCRFLGTASPLRCLLADIRTGLLPTGDDELAKTKVNCGLTSPPNLNSAGNYQSAHLVYREKNIGQPNSST